MFAKKSLGQNFLKSPKFLGDIVEAARLQAGDLVLEVGPGKGTLTEKLLEKAGKVVAVEKDDRLIDFLREKFSAEITAGKLEIIHADILELNPSDYSLPITHYKIVANLPYYITGQFIRKFLSTDHQPSSMTLLLQKEVAERIVARDSKESLLSLSVKAYSEPKYIEKVPARYFSPAPKVDSAILNIENISRNFFASGSISETDFFEILHAGFAHKRKRVAANLKSLCSTEKIDTIFAELKIDKNARAEDLSLGQWKEIAAKI